MLSRSNRWKKLILPVPTARTACINSDFGQICWIPPVMFCQHRSTYGTSEANYYSYARFLFVHDWSQLSRSCSSSTQMIIYECPPSPPLTQDSGSFHTPFSGHVLTKAPKVILIKCPDLLLHPVSGGTKRCPKRPINNRPSPHHNCSPHYIHALLVFRLPL